MLGRTSCSLSHTKSRAKLGIRAQTAGFRAGAHSLGHTALVKHLTINCLKHRSLG